MAGQRRNTTDRRSESKHPRDARLTPEAPSRLRAPASPTCKPTANGERMAEADRNVLSAFRKFLMVPGEMLCFANNDLVAMRGALARLTNTGMLVAERFPGAYSLTAAGFAMMRAAE